MDYGGECYIVSCSTLRCNFQECDINSIYYCNSKLCKVQQKKNQI